MTRMIFTAAAGLAALASASAWSATLPEEISLCAAAVDAEGLAAMSDYRTEFVKSRGAAAKRLTIELIPLRDGDVLTAECKIRGGEVQEVALTA